MDSVSSIISAVGGLTVLTTIQQVITGMLDERRKSAEAKRTRRREPLERRRLEMGNHAEADALADAENARLLKRIARLEKTIREQQAAMDEKDSEIIKQRGELGQLYRQLYNSGRPPPP